jgi:RND family efflux transporter MFP subunit
MIKSVSVSIWIVLFLFSCSLNEPQPEKKVKPVSVQTVRNESRVSYVRSIGMVSSKDIKKYGFKISGKISSIPVKKGDRVKKGTLLAKLETKELEFALNAAENTYKKAYDYFSETENFHSKIKRLSDAGSVAATDLDKAKLAKDVAESDMNNAKVDIDYKKSMVADASMLSEIEGYVIEVLNKKGEVVAAGYPVVVVRNESFVINTGVSSKELVMIKPGTEAEITVDGRSLKGKVSLVSQIPDERSRTYNVEVEISGEAKDAGLFIGSVAKVDFITGSITGIWIPVFSILTDGTDYVFTDSAGIALRKNIRTISISGEFVLVEGLDDGDRVIIRGMKDISDGDLVKEQ